MTCYLFKAQSFTGGLLLGFRCCEYPHWIEKTPGVYTPGDKNVIINATWESNIGTITPIKNKTELLAILKNYDTTTTRYFLSQYGTWEQCQIQAQSYGGNLATINDATENALMVSLFGGTELLWIGLTDKETENTFKWISGSTASYRNWATGEPNNSNIVENYTHINFGTPGKWNDSNGQDRFRGIIEINSNVVFNDCSSCFTSQCYAFRAIDTSGNTRIYFNCASNPTWLTSRSNASYFEPGNNSSYLRTSSGWNTFKGEIIAINNIDELFQVAKTGLVDNGSSTFYYYNGFKHFLTATAKSWSNAQAEAVSLGGNLVTIESQEKNDFISKSFGGFNYYWIGFTDTSSEGNFQWVSGKPVTFTNWAFGEPNNQGNEDFTVINFSTGGQWNDVIGSALYFGIIETKANLSDFGCTSCLSYSQYPTIKPNKTTIQLPNYYSFYQQFENTDVIAMRSQYVGSNAEILLEYQLIDETSKMLLEEFYYFSRNKSFSLDLAFLRIPVEIQDVIASWKTIAWMFKQEIMVKPIITNNAYQLYDISVILVSCAS